MFKKRDGDGTKREIVNKRKKYSPSRIDFFTSVACSDDIDIYTGVPCWFDVDMMSSFSGPQYDNGVPWLAKVLS